MSDSQQQDNVRDLLDACRLKASGPRRVIVEIDMTTDARLIDILDAIKPLGRYHSAKVRLNRDQPCQKTNANAGTASESTRHQEPDASARSEQTMEEPSVRALDSAHPIGVKIADTTSGAISVSPHVPASSGSAKECSGTAAPALDSAPPSEPEAVSKIRRHLEGGGYGLHPTEVDGLLAAYDTLSARLKRAEGLLHRAVPFLADNGHMEQQIENFLAEKGDA